MKIKLCESFCIAMLITGLLAAALGERGVSAAFLFLCVVFGVAAIVAQRASHQSIIESILSRF